MVFDGHSDLLYDVTRRRKAGETCVLERRHRRDLCAGSVEGLSLALWVRPEPNETFRDATEKMVAYARAEFRESPWLQVVRTGAEAAQAKKEGKLYAFLSVEGMAAAGEDPVWIDRYADFGVRTGMLTWNEENMLASGAAEDSRKGLTPLGKQAVREMEKRKMMVDVSHLNDGGFRDVMSLVSGPVLASHSNCRSLCDVPRNLTDDQLRAIRDTGGVVGVNSYHAFVHNSPEQQTVEMLARHAAHMAEVMGVEHVACGFDFCGYFGPGNESVYGLEDCARCENFFRELEKLGMTERERQMIARENLLRLL